MSESNLNHKDRLIVEHTLQNLIKDQAYPQLQFVKFGLSENGELKLIINSESYNFGDEENQI